MIPEKAEGARMATSLAPAAVALERDVPAAMRDGTVLRADVYRPPGEGPRPVLLERTVYDKRRREERYRALAARSPALGALLREGLGVPAGTRFLAFDVTATPRDRDGATSVFVTGTRREGPARLDEYVADGLGTLEQRPDVLSRLARRRLRLPVGQAHEVRLEMARPLSSSGGSPGGAVAMVQYFALERGTLYTIAFATEAPGAAHLPVFEWIARSFTLRDGAG